MSMKVALDAAKDEQLSQRLRGLIVVDTAPVRYTFATAFAEYINGMRQVNGMELTKRADADAVMMQYVKVCFNVRFLVLRGVGDADCGRMTPLDSS